MKFEEYQQKFKCEPLAETEQSLSFLVNRKQNKRVVKKYKSLTDKCREELAYLYLADLKVINIPELTLVGDDFIETEFLPCIDQATTLEIISEISRLYIKTNEETSIERYFPRVDLSKSKLIHRLSYLPSELEKRGFLDQNLLTSSEQFVDAGYINPGHKCLVHGDLKSPHIIKNKQKIYFIDLALVSIANPWYDLAFLYMEQQDKNNFFDELKDISLKYLGESFNSSDQEIQHYLKSAIFYRSLYNLLFATRHRPDKTLDRTLKELKQILDE